MKRQLLGAGGADVYFETEVKWPENVGRKDLQVEYSVKDKDGNEVAYLKVLKAIETQASFMDFIVIPESAKTGKYSVGVVVSDYGSLREEASTDFRVIPNQSRRLIIYFSILLGAICVSIFLNVFGIFTKKKG